jgi:hypothetical protein
MCIPPQLDQDLFRILLYRNRATELLVETSSGAFRLPFFQIPAHTRLADELTQSIRASWNLQTYCLFTLPSRIASSSNGRHAVLEARGSRTEPPNGMRWVGVAMLSANDFEDGVDFATLRDSLAVIEGYARGELHGTFGRPGWLRDVTEWVETEANALGLSLTGSFRQLNASPTFSLIRFETNGPALWFKAVGEPNLHELPITLKMAADFPEFIPSVIASQPEWNAWLALESEGAPLDASSDDSVWRTAAESLAALQIATFGRRFEFLEAGCKDLRPCSLLPLVAPFLDVMNELMEQQTKVAPPPLSGEELLSLGSEIVASLEEIADSAIPNTLGLLDANPGNVLERRGCCVFLDWAEAYVGPPFFTFQYLLEHRRRLQTLNSRQEGPLVSSYTKPWTRFGSSKEIAAVFRLVPLLAVFAYAVGSRSWRQEPVDVESARYLRGLTRRMKREADVLRESRSKCVS